MTALRKYLRLESPGLWRASPDDQLREVVVGLREATLVLSDPKTEMALSQWSLPALNRLNSGKTPALYAPGDEAVETLELDDADMIAALETVRAVLVRQRPRPGRLRNVVLGTGMAVTLALGVFWLPERLTAYTASVLPYPTRVSLGNLALADLVRLTGSPCTTKSGTLAASELASRVTPGVPIRLAVVRDGLAAPVHLPGGIVVLPAPLLDLMDGPEAVAGYVLAETLRAGLSDPTIDLLHHAGLASTLGLLTTGTMTPEAVAGYGEVLLRQAPVVLTNETLLAAFAETRLSTSPYAFALDPTGETTLALIEADPFLGGSPRPVLADGDWLNLQSICAP